MLNRKLILPVLALALAALACKLPGPLSAIPLGGATEVPTPDIALATIEATATQEVEATQTPEPTQELEATQTPEPTQEAQVTQTPEPTKAEMAEFEFKGVKFSYKKGQISDIQGQFVPAVAKASTASGWAGSVPEFYQIDINNFPMKFIFHKPQIYIYPIAAFAAANPAAGDMSKVLDDTLKAGAVSADHLPFLPMWHAAQVMHANTSFYAFKNGQGLRYLTCYSEAKVQVDNACLFYTYQGKTTDGKYYVSAVFPISMPAISHPDYKTKFDAAVTDVKKYEAYIKEMTTTIDQAKPADFNPIITDLDQLLMTLSVEPSVELKAP